MEGKLKDRIAVITGAGKGIGRATALLFVKEGAVVFAVARTKSDIESLAHATRGFAGKIIPSAGDVTDRDFVEKLFAGTEKEFGRLDILVNSAGFVAGGSIFNMDPDKFLECLKVNIWSTFLCTQQAARIMKKNNCGKIINLGSVRSHWTESGSAGAYNASKYGVKGFTESVARELHGSGLNISVGMVCPGVTDTPMTNPGGDPVPKYMKAEVVAKAILFAAANPENVNAYDITLFSTDQKPW
ncbi:MAG TPA: SDR family oxidoreductase [bacterium]|nr:SDR family oxidoreductase [bacterium]